MLLGLLGGFHCLIMSLNDLSLCTENAANSTKILKPQLWKKGLAMKDLRRCTRCEKN